MISAIILLGICGGAGWIGSYLERKHDPVVPHTPAPAPAAHATVRG